MEDAEGGGTTSGLEMLRGLASAIAPVEAEVQFMVMQFILKCVKKMHNTII